MSEPARRGHHKVFLGMAAGVGNTYRALQELRAELAADDVVIVDLTPPALIERLRALRIYPPERV
jgi:two-component system, OmpR family, sensor histidine kinase KdpD